MYSTSLPPISYQDALEAASVPAPARWNRHFAEGVKIPIFGDLSKIVAKHISPLLSP